MIMSLSAPVYEAIEIWRWAITSFQQAIEVLGGNSAEFLDSVCRTLLH